MLRMAVFLAVVIAVSQAVAQTISFAPVELYDAGFAPGSLRVADLNGDGYPDIVVNDQQSVGMGRVGVLLNYGDGTFGPRIKYGTGGEAKLSVGDLDGDGDLDVVAAGSFGKTFWYENDGSGVLIEHPLPNRTTTSFAAGLALLDYDNDGRLDIGVVTSVGNFEYSHNDGSGVLSPFTRRTLFEADYIDNWPSALDAVDLDGDGFPEFVAASHASRTFVRLRWVGHHFKSTVMHNVGRVDSVAYGDLDGLPGVDAVFTHDAGTPSSPSVGVWIDCNNGDGALTTCQRLRKLLDIDSPRAVSVADLNSDGINEIVVSDLLSQRVIILARDPFREWSVVADAGIGGAGYFIQPADVNRDGRIDLVVANGSGAGLGVLINSSP